MNNENEITLRDENRNYIKCNLLNTFFSEETGHCYAIYTDGEKDEGGNDKIWASRYKNINNKINFEDIEEEKEWDIIDKFIEDNMK